MEKSVNYSSLEQFENEWVALDKDLIIAAHNPKLKELQNQMGKDSKEYSYCFVPPSQYSYIGLA